MKKGFTPRILISLLGTALILMGVTQIALGLVGETTTAIITSIRRVGGERTDGKPSRYNYDIGYTFTLPTGKTIDGFAKKIGDSVYLKPDGTSTMRVRYFGAFPYINFPDRDTGIGPGQLTLILAGGGLIYLINSTKQRHD